VISVRPAALCATHASARCPHPISGMWGGWSTARRPRLFQCDITPTDTVFNYYTYSNTANNNILLGHSIQSEKICTKRSLAYLSILLWQGHARGHVNIFWHANSPKAKLKAKPVSNTVSERNSRATPKATPSLSASRKFHSSKV